MMMVKQQRSCSTGQVKKRVGLVLLSLLMLSGCSPTVSQYANNTPELDLSRFFQGPLEAHGILEGRSGEVTRRFSATLQGEWQGSQGVIDERFVFDDGEVQYRCWRIEKDGDAYRGTATDVVGVAYGEVNGNALNWRYTLAIDVDDKTWDVTLDDWLYLIDDQRLMNRTRLSKWGVDLAELSIYIAKQPNVTARTLRPECQLSL